MKKIIKTISILLIFALCVAFSGCAPKVELSSISFNGAKLEFAFNEEFSIGDLVVKAQYSDGSEEEITSYSIDSSAYDKTITGSYEILLSYEDKQASYNVTVGEPQLSAITVSGAKTEFDYNEEFSVGSLVVKAIYEDGSEQVVSSYAVDSSAYNKTIAGSYTVAVSYEGQSASYSVTVANPRVVEIELVGAKTEFEWNENFSVGSLVVNAIYEDGSEIEVTDYSLDSSAYVKNVADVYLILVNYNEISASYEVVVKAPPVRSITVSGAKTEFEWNENFSLGNLVVKARYADNNRVEVEDYEVDFSTFDKTISGAYTITVSYQGKSATYHVVVKTAPVCDLEIVSYKQEYTLYQNFKSSDIQGYIVRESGEKEELSTLNATFEVVGYQELKLGEFTVKVKSKENENVTCALPLKSVKPTSVKVLIIGECMANDATYRLPYMLSSLGYEFEVGMLYLFDSTIGIHYNNYLSNDERYSFRYFVNGSWNTRYGGTSKSFEYGVTFRDWDIIILSQQIVNSGVTTSFLPIADLIDGIKELATNPFVKFAFNMTWAYKEGATDLNFSKYSNDQDFMYQSILNVAKTLTLPIIPNGTVVQNVRTSYVGESVIRGDYRLESNYGRYLASLATLAVITGEDVSAVTYKPSTVTEAQRLVAIECVNNALSSPFEVTNSEYKTEPVV